MNRSAWAQAIERIACKKDRALAFEANKFAARTVFGSETNRSAQSERSGGARRFDPQSLKSGDASLEPPRFQRLNIPDGRSQHAVIACKQMGAAARQNVIRTGFWFRTH